ncbi:uncharacterized protein LOC108659749 [Drosophila navojoa]|uniref:uncharacterized protein LOC108659749 n=1 Tax=Drosophila navojoa TaxID=7232 RepID=UPI000847B719|nr:uncharacterized protein LOC108659749 [Drosophila navojoa]
MSIVLANSAHSKRRPSCSNEQDPSSKDSCHLNLKSTKLAATAADEASAAKNAQKCAGERAGQRAMERLADKAEQAARAAEAALNGKKLLLEQLEQSQCEADAVIEEVEMALARSKCNIDTIIRISVNIKNHEEIMRSFLEDSMMNLERYKEIAACANNEIREKYMILMHVSKRVEELKKCMEKAKKDLCRIEKIAEKAETAAMEATQRVEIARELAQKTKKLKKRDLKLFKRILKKFVKT